MNHIYFFLFYLFIFFDVFFWGKNEFYIKMMKYRERYIMEQKYIHINILALIQN